MTSMHGYTSKKLLTVGQLLFDMLLETRSRAQGTLKLAWKMFTQKGTAKLMIQDTQVGNRKQSNEKLEDRWGGVDKPGNLEVTNWRDCSPKPRVYGQIHATRTKAMSHAWALAPAA